MSKSTALTSVEHIESLIVLVRGERVILDSVLASLYGVSTMRLNERVSRSKQRFPPDFVFRLTKKEWNSLISQTAISKTGRGGRRTLPYVFTEHGAIMAANVLSSQKAVGVSVHVVRAFVRMREFITSNLGLARKLDQLEKKYDHHFKVVFDAIRQLMDPIPSKTRPIGFRPKTLK
jgi:hypothetical protein